MTLKNVNFGVVENFNIIKGLIYGGVLMLVGGCSNGSAKTPAMQTDNSDTAVCAPFDADSAYAYVARQVAFGPRVPGSESHAQCARYLADQLARFGADTVIEQTAELPEIGKIHNIMGRYSVHNPARVLLLAHWDTRPWADEDPDPENHSRPIDGANDGGSGVGVLLELSRQFGMKRPDIGVDILFVDAEDSGNSGDDNSWALGTQYFTSNLPYGESGPYPAYAILLDMVGGRDAVFAREMFSDHNVPSLVNHVWSAAARAGHGDKFVNRTGVAVNDDHLHLLRAGIPAIDIIECANPVTGAFNPTWHTMSDNIDNIDTASLRAAGETVSYLIYSEKL